jgi:glycosyltransferase involved in cell wall biosynthesis
MSYFACIIIRDGEKTIARTISSLINQTLPPRKIIVVNDGSTDSTGKIIDKYKNNHSDLIDVIYTDNKTRDYTRLPRLRTQAIEYAQTHNCGDCNYFMTAGGDCHFEPTYAEKILTAMENDPKLVLASGGNDAMSVSPRGAGRFLRASFFNDYRKKYPLRAWQESELKMRALCNGYKTAVVKEATFEHLDKLGHFHNFTGWGQVMKALGYSRAYVFAIFVREILRPGHIGRKGAMRILWIYLTYRPQKDGYYSNCEPELRKAVAKMQNEKIAKILIGEKIKRGFMKRFAPNAKVFYKSMLIANDNILPMNEELVREILSYEPRAVFEYGCGQGKNLSILSKKVAKVAGIDLSEAAVLRAKQVHGLALVQVGDESSLAEIESNSYDVVFTASVLDHIKHIDKIVEQLKRIASKAVVLLETNDRVGRFYYPHTYEKYGFAKTDFSYLVHKSYGKITTYYIWRWEKC